MANRYSNKWLKNNCPLVTSVFAVNKGHNDYWIQYSPAKRMVSELNTDMKNIKSAVSTLENDIEALKQSIDSQDYRRQTDALKSALDSAVNSIDSNMQALFTSVVKRLEANAESDSWFGQNAYNYANFIKETFINRK